MQARGRRRYSSLNSNVKLTLLYGALETSSSSLRSGDILSAYIHLQSGDYTTVGIAQGVLGLAELAVALPAGFAADHHRRDAVLRFGSLVGASAGVLLACVLLGIVPTTVLLGAMGLMGAYCGCYLPAMESIFAESLERGDSSMYTRRFIVQRLSSCVGPAISVAFFLALGNQWSLSACRTVLLAGLALMSAPLALLWAFNDDNALRHRRAERLGGAAGSSSMGGGGAEGPHGTGALQTPLLGGAADGSGADGLQHCCDNLGNNYGAAMERGVASMAPIPATMIATADGRAPDTGTAPAPAPAALPSPQVQATVRPSPSSRTSTAAHGRSTIPSKASTEQEAAHGGSNSDSKASNNASAWGSWLLRRPQQQRAAALESGYGVLPSGPPPDCHAAHGIPAALSKGEHLQFSGGATQGQQGGYGSHGGVQCAGGNVSGGQSAHHAACSSCGSVAPTWHQHHHQQKHSWKCCGVSKAVAVTALITASDMFGALASGPRSWCPCCP